MSNCNRCCGFFGKALSTETPGTSQSATGLSFTALQSKTPETETQGTSKCKTGSSCSALQRFDAVPLAQFYFKAVTRSGYPHAALVCLQNCKTHLIPAAPETFHPALLSTPSADALVSPPEQQARVSRESQEDGKIETPEDLQLQLVLFQSVREAKLEEDIETANEISEANRKMAAEARASWLERSEVVFFWKHQNGLGENGFHEYFGKASKGSSETEDIHQACCEAVQVDVLHWEREVGVVESWVRDGPFPSPWRPNKTITATISSIRNPSEEAMDDQLRVEVVLMSGAFLQVTVSADALVASLAAQIQQAHGFDYPVALIGPSGQCNPRMHISDLT